MNNEFKQGFDKLKQKWAEEPVQLLAVTGMALAGVAKFIDALSASKGRRAYARMVDKSVRRRR